MSRPVDPGSTAAPASGNVALFEALRARLSRGGHDVVVHETHLSWVLLVGRLAVKLKKAVRLPFVDFSTPPRRRAACDEELRLNRRLAPSLYRRVVGIGGTTDAPIFRSGTGDLDAIVCMRRFPESALLSWRLARGLLDTTTIERLARRIASFHASAQVQHDVPDAVRMATLPLEQVLAQIDALVAPERLAPMRQWFESSRARLAPVFRARQACGAVRDCHGDLHLANTVDLGSHVTAFDCIEFDPGLRRIDVMADIAFTSMDLQARGRADLAHRFVDTYLAITGDYAGLPLLRFHETARACVRALAQRLVARVPDLEPDYLAFAEGSIRTKQRAPRLAILSGVAGSGKSTISTALVDATGAVRVRSDVERKRLGASSATNLYTRDMTDATYARLAACARAGLAGGFDVLVDATFLRRRFRRAFERLAREEGAAFSIFACEAPVPELRRRVLTRAAAGTDASDADLAVLERQLAERDPFTAREHCSLLVVDTTGAMDVAALADRWCGASAPGHTHTGSR